MYDSNTSREPTASDRRGHEATGGDLKAHAEEEQDAPCGGNVPRCLAHFALENTPSQCVQTPMARCKRQKGIQSWYAVHMQAALAQFSADSGRIHMEYAGTKVEYEPCKWSAHTVECLLCRQLPCWQPIRLLRGSLTNPH